MTFFEITHKDKNTRARCGVMHTDHGDIETPVFMPVGTQASVKTLDSNDLDTIGAQIILGNNYHLHLRPGEDLIAEMGGLHKFMNWNKPILTDSGGFQVFSLGFKKEQGIKNKEKNNDHEQGRLVQIDEDGVAFKSHIDGSKHRFTPESATEMQHKIGADIIMAFDECTPDEAPEEYAREAMERTHRWAERSLNEHRRQLNTVIPPTKYGGIHGADTDSPDPCRRGNGNYQRYLFGIIQGANHKHLREESAKYISSLNFDGIAVGGESIGYNMEATKNIMDWIYPYLPENKPCYTMGVGLNPADLIKAVEYGADMFDCVAPTRLARHGMLFCHCEERGTSDEAISMLNSTGLHSQKKHGIASSLPSVDPRNDKRKYRINITNATFAKDQSPIDPSCNCPTCKNCSRAYLHHLFNAQEISAMRLASIHNLYFMLNLMRETREAIKNDKFAELKKKWNV